jgi:hypothetical protein
MLASLLFLAALAQATDNPPVIVEGTKPAEEKKVCRTVRETGSRMVKHVCSTPAQQRQDEQDAKNKLGLGNRSNTPPATFTAPTGQ